jgi:cellulose synthase/poly-beta-1,6-N-acetylglucosamine synthase-like glycosyltransferase
MTAFLAGVFFICLALIFYVYLGYPMLIACIGLLRPQPVKKDPEARPSVSILIPAYNEESGIEGTLQNKLALDYPKSKMEILVISDGSDDRTDEIVRGYAHEGVRLIRQEPRAGKTMALNRAVSQARGELIVFSDANSMYTPEALSMLASNFADPNVGYVTGKMIYTNLDGSTNGDGCSAYMKYENRLRQNETRAGSVVGVDGGIDAVRKDLYKQMNPDHLPDFILPLRVVEQGYRVVYEPNALLKEPALNEEEDEHRMRVRVTLRALWALYDMRHLLSFRRYGLFALQLWSHKVLRYACFIFLAGAFASNALLINAHPLFNFTLISQTAAYAGSALSPLLIKSGMRVQILYLLRYFVLINISAAAGFYKFFRGHKQILWSPRKG